MIIMEEEYPFRLQFFNSGRVNLLGRLISGFQPTVNVEAKCYAETLICFEECVTSELYGDTFVNNGAYKLSQQMFEAGHEVFLFSFDYYNPMSYGPLILKFPFRAATHCTELGYIFGHGILFPFRFNHDDHKMIDMFSELVANFVKYGDPNGQSTSESSPFVWKKLTENKHEQYLSVKLPHPEMVENFREGKTKFWTEIRAKVKAHHNANGDNCDQQQKVNNKL